MIDNIKLIVSEVDGVLTDGKVPIDELGNTNFKLFYQPDFEAINLIKSKYKIVFLSSDNSVTYHLMRRKNLPFFWSKKDKYKVFLEILRRYNVTAEEVIYVASKISDIACVTTVTLSFCPVNSNPKLISMCKVLNVRSGEGVFEELYWKYLK